jgi:hypothetical protein
VDDQQQEERAHNADDEGPATQLHQPIRDQYATKNKESPFFNDKEKEREANNNAEKVPE